MKNKKTENISGINSNLSYELSKLGERMNIIPEGIHTLIERQNEVFKNIPKINLPDYSFPKFNIPNTDNLKLNISDLNLPKLDFLNSEFLEAFKKFSKIGEQIKNNPEYQFSFITDLELLNLKSAEEFKTSLKSDLADEEVKQKEELLNKNLIPYLEKLGIEDLWIGANKVLESNKNPDKLRHCLVSLRTILEYLIDEKLAPINELKDSPMFEKEFKKFHSGKKRIEFVKIKREQKIEYFTSKINFGVLEEFTKNEIKYICDCYSVLCNIHKPNIGITENQVKSLKVKTGITIWLLAYINEIIKN